MKRKRKLFCSIAALLLCAVMLCGPAFAAPSLKAPNNYYYDGANVLSEATKQVIAQKNAVLDEACGAQLVVVTVNDTEGYSLEQYAYELFNAWGVGDKDKNNGVLLLLDIAGDDYQCLQGSGLETSLPTPTISRILRENLEPYFAARDYDAGVNEVFKFLCVELAVIYDVDINATGATGAAGAAGTTGGQTQPNTGGYSYGGYKDSYNSRHESGYDDGPSFFSMILFVVIVIVLISAVSGTSRRRRYGASNSALPFLLGLNFRPYRRYDNHHHHTRPPTYNPGNFNGGFSGGGLFGGGSGGFGGFGGFGGGGSFGGGGGRGGGFGGFGGGGSRGGGAGRGH